ncbi:hypothetical protein MPSEU_000074200 [Mayamaea pseudoterrestris]|nr:hypothetical protein MPSEU_000074200 [Mayamaea pseudoterrestris]
MALTSSNRMSVDTSIETSITQAVNKYLEDNHGSLDPIAKRQIKSWNFEWTSAGPLTDEPIGTTLRPSDTFSGQLTWKIGNSEHPIHLVLSSSCVWTETSLDWTCRVRAEVAQPPTETKQRKIFKRLLERLEKDDYISKLFVNGKKKDKERDANDDVGEDDSSPDGPILAEASIRTPNSGLEERVFTDPDVAEGLRRSIWNTAQDPIDILEFVIQYLPLLPCVGSSLEQRQPSMTKLANRAALRLLEDAMCDACEREGEEELVQDLHIQQKKVRTED